MILELKRSRNRQSTDNVCHVNRQNMQPEVIELSNDDDDSLRSRRPSPWHGKDTKGLTPTYEVPANPADSEPVFWNVYRHQETWALICGECDKHKPMVVLPNQWRNHLTRHHPDMDQNTKRKLGEMLRTYNVKELPTNIDTQLPMIPVVTRRYCFHCGGIFKNLRDHPPHADCFTGHKELVWCQFYHQNKGVIIGPTPRQPTEAQLRRMAREFLPPAKVYTRAELEDSRRRQMAESITFYRPHPWEICLWWDD